MSERPEEPEHVLTLPVTVIADTVHMRYCAYLVIKGQLDRTVRGECIVGKSWPGDSEPYKQLAIDDLTEKIKKRLLDAAGKK